MSLAPLADTLAQARVLERQRIEAPDVLARVAPLVDRLIDALEGAVAGRPPQRFELAGLEPAERHLLDGLLGQGEVEARLTPPEGPPLRVVEAVMPGLWRLTRGDHGLPDTPPPEEWLEVGEVPAEVDAYRPGRPGPRLSAEVAGATLPEGTMNARPVLEEIAAHATDWHPGRPNHVINLSHLPMSEADMTFLWQQLGDGALKLRSAGYGACEIRAMGVDHVWAVEFFNASGQSLLHTLEVGQVPVAARATVEDLIDSARRLADIKSAYL
ncbi:hydrogenase expression/formation protein [Roseospirillum parvum]|uniref:Hydrogenase-1 operon protein HyaF n=1 Tax=Roseospirillum parvum TaxID=83401 RepID=A0A1G8B0L9_9PROT|nr:hydrogenase expression/formation protein [Roseospirillum parvum]SDH26799.1 hydrogenase-1 operon protein HyaF [Roseospirillum parvum]